MNKSMVDMLVDKRTQLDLPAARELCGEDEVRFWLNAFADVLEQEGSRRYPYIGFKLEAWIEAAIWFRSETEDNEND